MASLYRTYRPKTFAEVAGQEPIKRTLQQEIAHETIAHAYLFSGPRAVGKTTTARLFIRALNCLRRKKGETESCNACDACEMLLAGRSLDVMEIDAASHTGVDNVREHIIAASRVGNTFLKYKAFIIDEVHMLSTSAFNALLKTLEEPPSHVIFILATTELHKVPATIISRCQRFDFKRIGAQEMKERLKKLCEYEKREVTDEVLDQIVRLSDGCQRDAESLLGQLLSVKEKRIDKDAVRGLLPFSHDEYCAELIDALFEKDQPQALRVVEKVFESGVDSTTFLNDCIAYMRMLLHVKSGTFDFGELDETSRVRVTDCANKIEMDTLLKVFEHLMAAVKEGRWVSLPQLPLEIAIVKVCSSK